MTLFILNEGPIYALPVIHYTMEMAMQAKLVFDQLQPDCVAVELPETLQEPLLRAACRLPDVSVVQSDELFYMCEPCDAAFEGLRCALEKGCGAYCIDLDVEDYPSHKDLLPDPYSILHIGLKAYYLAYLKATLQSPKHPLDAQRERHMAKRLKELSLRYDKILYIGGFFHIQSVLNYLSSTFFASFAPAKRETIRLSTLTEDACREVMAECGWVSLAYELWRQEKSSEGYLDRQKVLYHLYKTASERYCETTGNSFFSTHLRNTMKFARNYALIHNRLLPDLFETLSAAKGCVDHNYAYETWLLATHFPLRKNIDNLEERPLTIEEVWGRPKTIRFHLKQKRRKGLQFHRRKKDRLHIRFNPPSPFSVCSYPPEDAVIEKFGDFLKKKGNLVLTEEGGKTVRFSTSLEDGVDMRETIRHLYEKKLYVKVKGRPPAAAGSVVVIFDEDGGEEKSVEKEKFPWKTTWHGEHMQESDMAFYATHLSQNVVGPGIGRCEYGGFMLSYPPRRLLDIWEDPDYFECGSKAEVLLMAAIDYSEKPVIVFVAEKPPRSKMKSFASRFGKKICYIPLGQLSPLMLNKIRVFHVLDGHGKREIAGDYIF